MNTSVSWNDFDALYDNTSKKKTNNKRQKTQKTVSATKKRKKTFQLRSLPVSSTVTEEDVPDIMEAGPEPSTSSKELQMAETSFFNKKNSPWLFVSAPAAKKNIFRKLPSFSDTRRRRKMVGIFGH